MSNTATPSRVAWKEFVDLLAELDSDYLSAERMITEPAVTLVPGG